VKGPKKKKKRSKKKYGKKRTHSGNDNEPKLNREEKNAGRKKGGKEEVFEPTEGTGRQGADKIAAWESKGVFQKLRPKLKWGKEKKGEIGETLWKIKRLNEKGE